MFQDNRNENIKKEFLPEITQLQSIPTQAALALKLCLDKADVEEYKHFLGVMYHYTRRSEYHLKQAAKHSHTDELRDYFEHMAAEEKNHYKLAEHDLKGYGLEVSEVVPESVKDINNFWDSLETTQHGNGYIGIVYVFENIAKHIQSDIKDMLLRVQANGKQSRWLRVHAEADLDHGQEAEEIMLKYLPDNPKLLIETAQRASLLWIRLMQEAFSPSEPKQKRPIAA